MNACHIEQSLIIVIDKIPQSKDFHIDLLHYKKMFVEVSSTFPPQVFLRFYLLYNLFDPDSGNYLQ